jgi:hypothetical protein
MLTASGRLLTMDLEPLTDRNGTFIRVATRFIENQSWHLRKLAPEAFVRTDFAEFSWFGTSNLTNTAPIPAFPVLGQGGYEGRRVLLSYDAGRPVEVSPLTLEHLVPGRPLERLPRRRRQQLQPDDHDLGPPGLRPRLRARQAAPALHQHRPAGRRLPQRQQADPRRPVPDDVGRRPARRRRRCG